MKPSSGKEQEYDEKNLEEISNLKFYVIQGDFAKCLDLAQKCQDNYISVDIVDIESRTPLHHAASSQHYEICRLLIDHGANIFAKNRRGETAFEMIKKSNIAPAGINALIRVAILNAINNTENFDPKLFKKLIAETDINWREEKSGRSFLHLAAYSGNLNVLKLLVENGSDINAKDNKDHNAFHFALSSPTQKNGQRAIMGHILLDYGMALDLEDNKGRGLLHLATSKEQYTLCEDLIKRGANINKQDNEGKTPAALFSESKNANFKKVASTLFVNTPPPPPASKNKGNKKSQNKNVRNIGARDDLGFQLHLAIIEDREEDCRRLIKNGANLDIMDNDGWTVLHQAILLNRQAVSKALLEEHDINVNAVLPKSLMTPLHMAARRGSLHICQSLIEHGAEIGKKDKYGKTALDYATRVANSETDVTRKNNFEEVIKYLSPSTKLQEAAAVKINQNFQERV